MRSYNLNDLPSKYYEKNFITSGKYVIFFRSRKEHSKPNSEFLYPKVGLPRWLSGKQSTCNAEDVGDSGLIPGVGRSPEGGHGYPLTVFLSGESHGQRSLVGYSPRGHKESDMTEVTKHTYPNIHT